ncbi:MAG: Ig-like domain-containing protein [Planctomycetota bacterium]|nr:Ig-like domain-containing protein [Planctomycetota bacterium]
MKARQVRQFRRTLQIEQLEDRRMLAIGINLLAADDSGWSSSDRITNVTQPRFEVTVDQPGLIGVDFNADGTSDVDQSVDVPGTYEFPSSMLADGDHTIAATFTPLAGDAEQASVLVTIDTQGPKLARGPIVVAAPYSQRTLTFDENIDPASLTVDDVAFSAVAGDAVSVTDVVGADTTYSSALRPSPRRATTNSTSGRR